jgi:hypothetical protein
MDIGWNKGWRSIKPPGRSLIRQAGTWMFRREYMPLHPGHPGFEGGITEPRTSVVRTRVETNRNRLFPKVGRIQFVSFHQFIEIGAVFAGELSGLADVALREFDQL